MEKSVVKTRKRSESGKVKSVEMKRNITQEDIRQRAFEIYKENGVSSHNELDDWLRAEQELTGEGF